jgi:conjugal transfer ATP-binding protein TraC
MGANEQSILAKAMQMLGLGGNPDQSGDDTTAGFGDYQPTPIAKWRSIVSDQPRLADLLPYESYDEANRMFINDDSMGFVLEGRPLTGANESIARSLSGIYVNCPSNAGVQFILYAAPNCEKDFKDYGRMRVVDPDSVDHMQTEAREKRNTNVFRTMARKRINYLRKGLRKSLFTDTSVLVRNFRLIVSVTMPGTGTQSEVEVLTTLRDMVKQSLDSAMIRTFEWKPENLIQYAREVLNPHLPATDVIPDYDNGRLLKHQMVNYDTVTRPQPKGILVGNADHVVEVRFMSVTNYPRNMAIWDMGNLIGDALQNALRYPCPFLLALNVHVPDYDSTKQKATVKSARATQNADSVMAKFMPDMKEKKADWDIVMQSLNEGQRLAYLSHQLVLFTNPKNADMHEQQARAIFRTKSFDLANDVYMQPQALFSMLPMSLSKDMFADLKRTGRVSTKTGENAAHMAPVVAEWAGTKTPTFLLLSRRGQLMYLDLFDNDQGNFNAAVAGASGTGKSVFLNDLTMAYIATGAIVRTIDIGHSYEKTSKIVGGQYIEFNPESNIVINPFPLIKDFTEEIELLKPLLLQMAHPKEKPTDYENTVMQDALQVAWSRHGTKTTVTLVAETLKEMATTENGGFDQRIHDLGRMLMPYTKDGVYGRYFEGEPTVNFTNRYVVLELEDLKKKQDLLTVVMLMMIFFIQQDLFMSSREQRKVIMIDEAHELLGAGNGTAAEFLDKAYRRARKHGGSIICASQSVNDYYIDGKSPILDNADWLFLLRQKPEALEILNKTGRLSLDEGLKRLLLTVKTEQGRYSEVFIHSAAGTGVGRLVLDPYSLQAYSTKAEDYALFKRKESEGYSTAEALEQILLEKGIES